MAFNGNEGGTITLDKGSAWTKNWRDDHPNASKGIFIGKTNLETLLNQSGAKGIRFYFAINDDDEETLVLVAAEEDEDDNTNIVINAGVICPPKCGTNNALNSDL